MMHLMIDYKEDNTEKLRDKISMLFHNTIINRPVKGSVIVNGGVQLSGGKNLVDTKLATLHFGAE